MLKYLSVVALCIFGIQAQNFLWSMCPNFEVQDNVAIDQLLGKWYEQQNYNHKYENNLKCVEVDFTRADNNDTTINVNIGWKDNKNNAGSMSDIANMWFPGYFQSELPIPLGPDYMMANKYNDNYRVFAVEKDEYLVIYSCAQIQIIFNYFGSQNVWILTRDQNPSKDVLQRAWDAAYKNNTYLKKRLMKNSNRNGC